jgi:hypothetical protein
VWKGCDRELLPRIAEARYGNRRAIAACIRNPVSGLLRNDCGAQAWAAEK